MSKVTPRWATAQHLFGIDFQTDMVHMKTDEKIKKLMIYYDRLKANVGLPLTELIFDCKLPQKVFEQEFVEANNIEIKGPQEQLWASPSEQLIGKIKMKVPIIRRKNQVLCFEYINQYGEDLEKKFMEKYKDEEKQKFKELQEQMKIKNRIKMEQYIEQMKVIYGGNLKEMFNKLYEEFQEEIKDRENTIIMEAEKSKQQAINELHKEMESEMSAAINTLENFYYRQLNFVTDWKSNKLRDEYDKKIKMNNVKWKEYVDKAKATSERRHQVLLRSMESEKDKNLCLAINAERDKLNNIVHETAYYFINRLENLRKEIDELNKSLKKANYEIQVKQFEIESWECLMKDVAKQFQKFINYTLQVVPGDAEYLLSLEKLIERKCQLFDERMKTLAEITEKVHPLEPHEKLDESEEEYAGDVIEYIKELILMRGSVILDQPKFHDGVCGPPPPPSLENIEEDEEECLKGEHVSDLSDKITSTISTEKCSKSNISSDKSYSRYYPYISYPKELYGEFYSEDAMLMGRVAKTKCGVISSPKAITHYSDTDHMKKPSTLLTTTPRTPSKIDSNLISSTAEEDVCGDKVTTIRTISEHDWEIEKNARKLMSMKFVGMDLEPPPKDKETFIQGRVLSILNIMKAHPQLHNVLIEP